MPVKWYGIALQLWRLAMDLFVLSPKKALSSVKNRLVTYNYLETLKGYVIKIDASCISRQL